MHARFLYEPSLYPQQEYTQKIFDKYFPRNSDMTSVSARQDICSIGFEPNPHHKSRLQLLQAYYHSKSMCIIIYYIYLKPILLLQETCFSYLKYIMYSTCC